ncbi:MULTISPECIES: restriction endonuclease subunit S [unclassified Marinobacter]|uniref:restriction endonuclease subunit S n=1 Tax=unclassified Marinobacter TaxID=83889 RepID=UPI002010BBFD|nr:MULTISPECIES: restriction endonuclease subunit S [unclassified Marinobacter]MCL1481713.1 restriction endonuclease subunit S [Marinobacter sp.]UQG55323.1 restriction endonuclease subunit S [Marinobacter sp. M4C]UQG64126.1 restriction endonuclease subunit S [Marinobacter sp. M2C]UQG68410.1 restriction endonuclease subunit S [Marinobacter sp. M1C]
MSSELSVSQDWNESQMQEFCVKVADGTHDSPKKTEQGKLLVTSKNIIGGTLDLTKSYRISEEDFNDVNRRSKVDINDVLLSMIGTVGEVCLIENEPDFAIKNVGLLKNHDPLKAKWLYFYLTSPLAQAQIKERLRGTTQQYLPLGEIRKFPIIYPESRTVMQEIVGVLAALQDKIQLNHQINQTLEQIAQAIFKSWFVDFEPVKAKIAALEAGGSEDDALLAAMQAISGKTSEDLTRLQTEQPEQYTELRATAELFPSAMQESELGELPEGWSVDQLSELIQFNPRRSLKKGALAPYLDMKNVPTSGHLAENVVLREMNSGTKFINGDTLLARITPCLENGKTAFVDFLESGQVGWGSTEYIVMKSKEPYPESISYVIARDTSFRQHAIQSMTGTSGRQRASAKALAELPWIIYPQALAEAFNRIASPYLRLARSHGNESKSLSAMRDSLLPKLLSGALKITTVGT